MSDRTLPLHYSQTSILKTSCERAFAFLDDFEQLGSHMMGGSWMMAGSGMRYEFDAARGRAPGARIRLTGSMLGLRLRIEEEVTEREVPRYKSWITTGAQHMLILDAYRMGFSLEPVDQGARLEIFIDYARPAGLAGRLLGWLLGGVYARWCVRSMVAAAVERFGGNREILRRTDHAAFFPGERRRIPK
jgi:hypothetical protein